MKLRNKRTGEIGQIGYVATQDGQIIVEDISGEEYHYSVICSYKTLAELNEDWEDYEPKEPLIKDEKIRKAVRAWANSFDDVDEIKASDDYKEFWIDGYLIEFERSFNEVESEHTYRRTNIAELCGEEGE